MLNRPELKSAAKAQIKGKIGILFLCMFLIGLITSAATPLLGAGLILAPAFSISMIMIYLALIKGDAPEVGDIFKGFNLFGKALWLSVITQFFVFLWSLLFFIPGIIKAIAYSMAPYILAENPDMTAREALNKSKEITQGHKGELFVLALSFIGWILLTVVTFGIAFIYVGPYMQATYANTYRKLSGNAEISPAPTTEIVAEA
ncbi:MAG: DUF975 family protein [Oscillospiraceae bacterium]|nr:DUF975 family protein [Oscillospiraceae bacterium]